MKKTKQKKKNKNAENLEIFLELKTVIKNLHKKLHNNLPFKYEIHSSSVRIAQLGMSAYVSLLN